MRARWCSFPARPASANRGSRRRCWNSLADGPHTRLRYFCSPQHTDSAFYPIIGQMERAAGLAHDDTPQARLDKLDALLAHGLDLQPGRGALCRDAVAAERRPLSRARTDPAAAPAENAGSARLADAKRLPSEIRLLMIFEDAHWIDPTSLELFGRAMDRIATFACC